MARSDAADAVLCDLMMPQMTGIELHARLSVSRPEVAARMVFLTGGVCWSLGKPFDPRALLELVAERIANADALAPSIGMV